MAISFQPSHKAELHVQVGKTSVQELQKFHDEVSAKGGGEIRAKKNSDGSYTLYVAADRKLRLSSLNSKWGKDVRVQKQELAKTLMADIISRRLPPGKKGAPSLDGQRLLQKISGEGQMHTSQLGEALKDLGKQTFDAMPQAAKDHYSKLDTIMSTPGLRIAFGKSLDGPFGSSESFEFLSKMRDYSKAGNPQEKLKLAEEIFKMIESPENPATSSFGAKGPVQINISRAMAAKIHEDIQHLRQAIVEGREPSPEDLQKLDKLFSEADAEVRLLVTQNYLGKFVGSDAFKSEAGNAFASTISREKDSDPASYLRPGSGKEYLERTEHFSKLENVLENPEMRSAFRDHLGTLGKTDRMDHYEALENLATLAESGDISDEELIEQAERLLVRGGDAPRPRDGLSLDDGVEHREEDSHQAKIKEQIGKLKMDLASRKELMGDSVEGRRDEERLFGRSGDIPSGKLVRPQIKSFLETMKADAANGLRFDGFPSFKDQRVGTIIGQKMFSEQLDWRPGLSQHFGEWDRFAGRELEGSGGATGSGRAKIGKQHFQVKGSIAHAGFGRRWKADGLNTENYGEVIASNVARSLVGAKDRRMIPEVSLRQDGNSHEAMVTSKYLAGGKGDLKALYVSLAGPLPEGQKHPKIHLDSPGLSGEGILRLNGEASRDVRRNIALSALLGDHDVNPGNMIALQDGRVGRIDFGHAFNELINGPGGTLTGGGGVRNKSNRILDFFNRETVSGNPLSKGQMKSKLWRDYTGAGPSEGMTASLRSVASSTEAIDGLAQAKSQYIDLIASLELEGTPAAKKQIEDLTKSLARISKNIEKPITSTDPSSVVRQVFENLETFVREGQAQMRDVADLSELQTKIDAFVLSTRDNPSAPVPPDITQAYQTLTARSVKTEDGAGLNWMKMKDSVPAFKGDLGSYIQTRRTELTTV